MNRSVSWCLSKSTTIWKQTAERPIWNRYCSTAPPFGETCRAAPMWPAGVRVIKTCSVSRWEWNVCKHSRAIGVHWPQRGCLILFHPNYALRPDSTSTGVPRLKMKIFSTSCRLVSFFFFKVILTRYLYPLSVFQFWFVFLSRAATFSHWTVFLLPFTVATLNKCKVEPAAVDSTSSPRH